MRQFLLLSLLLSLLAAQCVHDSFAKNTTKHFYNDLAEGRRLQQGEEGKLRIFIDYTQVTVGGDVEINTIKRVANITASYFYNVLKVMRLQRLYFPENVARTCNVLTIPEQYVSEGTIGDLGVVCGNEANQDAVYVAKSTPCAFLESNKRPIWGMMQWNNAYLKYDQQGFQQILFVGLHEMTHILGFSALMYELFPTGNPLVQDPSGDNYLNSPRIQEEVERHFGCNKSKGMLLQDQDGTLIASHWERKVVGNEFMIASNKKSSFMSNFTLALLESTGWYTEVSYAYAEKTTWGKGKGCEFLNSDNCDSEEFCADTSFSCDWDATAIGRCNNDVFAGACKIIRYYTNTVCVDENYELKNLNAPLNALERGGSNSRCFSSSYRETGIKGTKLNNRCYISVCSFSGRFIFILVGKYILVCRAPGQQISAPVGLEGTLTCPSEFANYCQNKKTCPYHCNKNGACIDGVCLCTGTTKTTPSCLDVSIYQAPVGSTGGLLRSLRDQNGNLRIDGGTFSEQKNFDTPKVVKYSINKKCFTGSVFDPIFGECLRCRQVFNCDECEETGCISCDNGMDPVNGRCLSK